MLPFIPQAFLEELVEGRLSGPLRTKDLPHRACTSHVLKDNITRSPRDLASKGATVTCQESAKKLQ